MGAFLGLCTPAGGPCGAEPEMEKRANHRPQKNNNLDHQEVPSGSMYDEVDDESSDDAGTVRLVETPHPIPDENSHLLSTKKVPVSPFIGKHIICNPLFKAARDRTELQMARLGDIDKVEFREGCWWLQGADSIALEDGYTNHKGVLDIVVWRIPIIPAFSYFESDEDFYELVFDAASPAFIDIEGIWSIMSKQRFIKEFESNPGSSKVLEQVKLIQDEQHQYLVHDQHMPQRSGEFQELITKLKKIEGTKKGQIVMVGQRRVVKDVLRAVRQKEVRHQSMATHLRDAWEVHPDDDDAPDPNFISSHSCVISNLPKRCGVEHIHTMLEPFDRWSYVVMLENEYDQNDAATPVTPQVTGDDADPDIVYNFAKISFDTPAAMETFVEALNAKEGLFVGTNKISIGHSGLEQTRRHIRWLHDGAMIS